MAKLDPVLQDGIDSLSIYLYLVHDTDMPEVHGGKAMPMPHHQKMIDVLVNDSYGHSLLLAPRGAAKTKLLQAYVEWKLGRASLGLDGFGRNWARDFRVGWISASASKAYGVSNAIRETIEFNPIYQAMFPKVKKHKDKWSEGEWKVRGNPTKDSNFIAAGRGGAILGSRFHLIIPDDIAGEDERSSDLATATKPRRDLLFWMENTMMKCLVPRGRIIMAATRWYEGDPPEWAMEQGWHVLLIQALTDCDGSCENDVDFLSSDEAPSGAGLGASSCPGEHSYWEAREPAAKLIADRKKNPRSFALQMQNEIVPSVGVYFRREWFSNRFDRVPVSHEVRAVVATWDTAGTETGRSYTAGLVVAIMKDWRYFILRLYRAKLQYPEVRELIREVANIWKVSMTLIEAKSTGQSVLQELSRHRKYDDPDADGVYGDVVGALPPGQRGGPTKDLEYVDQITVPVSEGRVWLPATELIEAQRIDDWRDIFLKELIQYPDGQNDDIVMALQQLIYRAERNRNEFEQMERERLIPQLTYTQSEERAAIV